MNKVIMVGNLTKDPELKTIATGVAVCNFSIAVNRPFASANGEREADFFNVVVWRALAENCGKYLTKGKKVAISGRLETRTYDDKDGNKRYVTEIVADDVEFLSPKSDGESNFQPSRQQSVSELKPVESEDLPF